MNELVDEKIDEFGSVVMVCLLVLMRLVLILFLVGDGLMLSRLFFDCSYILMFFGMWFVMSVGRLMLRFM